MSLNRISKIHVNKYYGGYDFTRDGQYEKPRVKGKDKRMRSKARRTYEKRLLQQEVREGG